MTIDANIIIAYLNGEADLVKTLTDWRQSGLPLFLSTIVETEILSFSGLAKKELQEMEKFLEENFISIPFDRVLAKIAAEIRRNGKIKFPDAAIAATALFTRTPLNRCRTMGQKINKQLVGTNPPSSPPGKARV